ncbi:MAG: hypothetical protein COU65_03775 [Candidatus Pacebacteria bacterium CG10_big_fil_rev_8_21_14_0_10_42_12]|nr:hypothetical protein [Candidatus Paceibacterota bacterium]PIR62361.1 MAG: hypothetical protein COU65_03775 [Candidatus Pacebacteria bacterium CG10_big_fil_rev_8_21_14_0_10_42_12]
MQFPTQLAQFGGFKAPVDTVYTTGSDVADGAFTNLEVFFSNLLGILTVLGSIFFIVNFLIGALGWITAGGESGKIETARNRMVQSAIGLVIIVAAYGIIGIISTVVGIDILNPAEMLKDLVPTP